MDRHKHLLPRFSYAMKDLAEKLGVFEQTCSQLREARHELAPHPADVRVKVSHETHETDKSQDNSPDV